MTYVGGWCKTHKPTVTISTGIYAAGDSIGGKLTLSDATRGAGADGKATGVIQTIRLVDQDNEQAEIDVVFFDADPSGTTFTDNGALDVADADMAKIIGYITIAATDYIAFADNAVATKTGLGFAFSLAEGYDLYAAMVVRGTPTYTATTDLALAITVLMD